MNSDLEVVVPFGCSQHWDWPSSYRLMFLIESTNFLFYGCLVIRFETVSTKKLVVLGVQRGGFFSAL